MIQPPPSATSAISWIVVNTHPHKERFAVESLKGRQFIGYCPMLLKRIRHARRSELVLRPMFPAHVFAGLNTGSQRWQPILSTPGVSTMMSRGRLLNFVPADFVAALRACEIDGKVAPSLSGSSEQQGIEPGKDYNALITTMVEMSEDGRLRALFGLLGPAT
jgi:transcriptional antiterminator RfaH